MIRQVVSQFFQTYWNTIAEFTDPTICYDDVSYCLHLCISFDQYRSTLVAQCSDLMQQISKQSDQKTSPAIQKVIAYVKNNIDKPISLDDAAQAVELSSGYLSMLFKKEMNTSFTKYVNAQKNMVACNLLKTSNLNISEIADRIGISDVRAFSKKFHIMNDTTPSAYRKLHHTEKGHVL